MSFERFVFAVMMLAGIPSAALPGAGLGSMRPPAHNEPPRTEDPAIVVEHGFEQLLGRDLNRREAAQLKIAVREFQHIQAQQERPQQASFISDFFSHNEFLPVFCFYGKISGKLPKVGSVNVGGVGFSAERMPCLLTNSMLPWQWRTSKFKSYIMKGISATSAGAPYGGIAAGVSGGLYIGPKNTTRQFVGTYMFGRLMYEKGLVNVSVQAAYNDNKQTLVMVGAAGEIGWDAMMRAVRVLPSVAQGTVSVAGWKFEGGMYYNVKEFPWFERLMNGWTPIAAFQDMEEYIARNN